MEGTHRITIREPIATSVSSDGSISVSQWQDHVIWAERVDRGGGHAIEEDIATESWNARFQFRNRSALSGLTTNWVVIDSANREYQITERGAVGGTAVDQQRINKTFIRAVERKSDLSDIPVES